MTGTWLITVSDNDVKINRTLNAPHVINTFQQILLCRQYQYHKPYLLGVRRMIMSPTEGHWSMQVVPLWNLIVKFKGREFPDKINLTLTKPVCLKWRLHLSRFSANCRLFPDPGKENLWCSEIQNTKQRRSFVENTKRVEALTPMPTNFRTFCLTACHLAAEKKTFLNNQFAFLQLTVLVSKRNSGTASVDEKGTKKNTPAPLAKGSHKRHQLSNLIYLEMNYNHSISPFVTVATNISFEFLPRQWKRARTLRSARDC